MDTEYQVNYNILGLDSSRNPTRISFPQKLNRYGKEIWQHMFQDDTAFLESTKRLAPQDAWKLAIEKYMSRAKEEGISPFEASLVNKNNDLVTMDLTRKRRTLAAFINKHRFFDHFRLDAVETIFDFPVDGGLSISVEATLRPQTIDENVVDWIRSIDGPRFRRSMTWNAAYYRVLSEGIELQFHLQNVLRGKFSYVLTSEYIPVATDMETRLLSRSDLAAFTNEHIWLPIVRANRLANVGNRPF